MRRKSPAPNDEGGTGRDEDGPGRGPRVVTHATGPSLLGPAEVVNATADAGDARLVPRLD